MVCATLGFATTVVPSGHDVRLQQFAENLNPVTVVQNRSKKDKTMNARNQIINALLSLTDQQEVIIAQLQTQIAELKKKYEPAPVETAAPATLAV